jgi:seipin
VTVLPIHLQYGYGPNPYGVASLPNIKDNQAYDISVSLTLPRSPSNIDRGNFMIALSLLDKPGTAVSPPISDHDHTQFTTPSLFARLLFLPARLLFPSSSSCTVSLTVPLVGRLSFPSGSVPSALFLELQAGQSLRVASASVTVTAQLSGLRWLMHHYRVSAFLAGTAAFWGCEVVSMAVAWLVLSAVISSSSAPDSDQVKLEEDGKVRKRIEGDMSDTERTFPTTSRAPPLKYESSGGIKEEEVLAAAAASLAELPIAGGEADDEDDEPEEGWRDSGIGTSYSDAGVGGVRRRVSGKGR